MHLALCYLAFAADVILAADDHVVPGQTVWSPSSVFPCYAVPCCAATADIARDHPELYRVWREEPERFCLDGRYPVLDAFRQSRRAWTGEQTFSDSMALV
jgi:hypothetical protein